MPDTLASALRDAVARLLAPLSGAVGLPRGVLTLLRALGRSEALGSHAALRAEIERLAGLADDLSLLDETTLASWEGLAELLDLSREIFSALRGIESLLDDPTLATQARDLGSDLVEQLFALYLRTSHPRVFRTACLLTLITPVEVGGPQPMLLEDGVVTQPPWLRDRFHLDRLADLVRDPLGMLAATYLEDGLVSGADAHEAGSRLFVILRLLASAVGLSSLTDLVEANPRPPEAPAPANDDLEVGDHLDGSEALPDEGTSDPPPTPPIDLAPFYRDYLPRFGVAFPTQSGTPAGLAFGIVASSSEHPGGVQGLIVNPVGDFEWSETRGQWLLELTADGQVPAFVIGPGGLKMAPTSAPVTGASAHVVATRSAAPGSPAFRFGSANGTRIEIGRLLLRADLEIRPARQVIVLGVEALTSALVLAAGDGDGFLQEVLPKDGFRANFDLGLLLSSEHGLQIRGGAGLKTTLPVGATLGPATIQAIHLELAADAQDLRFTATCTATARIGPIQASVERIGLGATLAFPQTGGNLGLADLNSDFVPPTGLGLAIDAGPVTGGGFLRFEENQYSGAVALKIGKIAATAYGIIETKLPDGREGYSFLLVISAKFPKPIELGLGIKLVEVGGLVGIQRTMAREALQKTLQSGVLDHLLFPADPVQQAPAILAAVRDLFPVAEGRYIFGPMVRLTWATPKIVEARLGFFLEVPEPIRLLVLGTIAVGLPSLDLDRVRLNLDVAGLLEISQKRFSLDGRLRDSQVGGFPLSGDMALRLAWGDAPQFALAIGGLHPQFPPPPGFPALRRVTMDLSAKGNPRIKLEGYLAVTPNTLQVGARVELTAEKGSFNIYGWLGFDALFVRVPFSFTVDFAGGVAIRRKSTKLATVHLDATLSGPRPFRAKGEACISLWLFEACVPFDATFGTPQPPEPLTTAASEIRNRLQEALEELGNWEATLPAGGNAVVSVAAGPASGPALFDPLGSATLRQRVLPLGMKITRFGGAAVEPTTTFQVASVELSGVTDTSPAVVEDFFAPAQFRDMTDAEKLSSPSFEKRPAGFTVRSGAVDHGPETTVPLEVETVLVVPEKEAVKLPDQKIPGRHFDAMLSLTGAATGGFRASGFDKFADPAGTPQATLGEERFLIAGRRDGAPAAGLNATPATRTEALFRLRDHLAEHPEDRGRLEVMPAWEVTP